MSQEGKSRTLKFAVLLSFSVFGVLLLLVGFVFGIWFSTNFQIVPRGDLGKMMKETLEQNPEIAKLTAGKSGDVSQTLDKVLGSQSPAVKELAQQLIQQQTNSGAPASGPFTFKFKSGERLEYTLSASMTGEGMEAVQTAPVKLNLGGKFDLVTESVDGAGNGVLRMAFRDTALKGDMMGTPFTLTQDVPAVPPASGDTPGSPLQQKNENLSMPLLSFLNTPVRMSVSPNGVVHELPDAARPNPLVEQLPMLTSIEFPSPDMQPGTQWESYFNMSVPGSGAPMKVRLLNTFTGYKTIGKRLCAVIDQQVSSEPAPSQPGSPGEALGMMMGIKPPQIDLSGDNTIYFDTDNGQLVHSEMDLGMHVDMSESLGAAGKALGGAGLGLKDMLGDLSGDKAKPAPGQEPKPQDALSLNMKINAGVSLVDPVAPEEAAGATVPSE